MTLQKIGLGALSYRRNGPKLCYVTAIAILMQDDS